MDGRFLRWSALALIATVAAIHIYNSLSLREGITEFLPEASDTRTDSVFRAFAASDHPRRMTLTIGAESPLEARRAAVALADSLRFDPEVAWVEAGPNLESNRELYNLYFPRRLLYLSLDPEREVPEIVSEDGLRRAARSLLAELNGPLAPFVSATASSDPLGGFRNQIERLSSMRPSNITVVDGAYMTTDLQWAVVMLGTRSSAFAAEFQAPFLGRMDAAFAEISHSSSEQLILERSGVNRFAAAATEAIRADISRITIASLVTIALVFFLLFRSVGAFVAALVPLVFAVLAGLGVGLAFPGGLHILTLAFGATLLGVCIDYPVHLLTYHSLEGGDSPRSLWSGMAMGALTTVVGFACLAFSPYPGIRELAIFAATGVAVAATLTRFVLPALLPKRPAETAALGRTSDLIGALLRAVRRTPRLATVPLILATAVALLLPFVVRWEDDVSRFNTSFPELEAEEAAVQARIADIESSRFVVALGRDEQSALGVAEQLHRVLEGSRADGLLEGFRSVSDLVRSIDLQERNLETLRAAKGIEKRLDTRFVAEGFRPGAFTDFGKALEEQPSPLTFADLEDSPLQRIAELHRLPMEEGVAFVTALAGVHDREQLRQRIERVSGALYVDQPVYLREAYATYRQQAIRLFIVGMLLVTVILAVRYRCLKLTAIACAPTLLAIGSSLTILSLHTGSLHLLHVLSSVLVFGMGVDYGVFLLESRGSSSSLRAAALSVVLAAGFTLLSFGLLALSANGALRAIGQTISLGVPLSLIFAILAFGALEPMTAGSTSSPERAP